MVKVGLARAVAVGGKGKKLYAYVDELDKERIAGRAFIGKKRN
ncbi:MAG: hypothetical protein U0514_04020 [Candidatus Andersenbacteria bacterium]